jgi:tetratricopeptide (TPR) repeat protein
MADQDTADSALEVLAAYNMITPAPGGAGLSIHRLVQAVARTPDPTDPHRATAAIQRARTRAAETLRVVLPDYQDPGTWSTWRALLPHIETLTGHTAASDESVTATIALIRNHTGLFLLNQGMHISALTHHHRALADFERILGPDHPNTLGSRNNLAGAYASAGRTAEAIPLLEQTLTDAERILGPDHPNTSSSRNNLAQAYESVGRTAEAILLLEQALADRERIFGSDHPNTGVVRGNLAVAREQRSPR